MQNQPTQTPAPHFLCRDRKDREYLHHNLDVYVLHSRGRGDASVYLKSMEEASDAVKDFDELVSARASIFSRLRNLGVRIGSIRTK